MCEKQSIIIILTSKWSFMWFSFIATHASRTYDIVVIAGIVVVVDVFLFFYFSSKRISEPWKIMNSAS